MTKHCSRCGHDSTEEAMFCPRCGNSLKGADADPLLGTLVADRYILLEKIGDGRSGVIYRGEHNSLRKKVAVKILHEQLSQDENAIERFRREATTVCEIDNDHILQVLDFGRAADRRLFFAMELLDGETLAKVLEREGKLPVKRVVDIISQTGEALMEAHGLGYVHRDLRPRNLFLITKRGRGDFVKLLDFGLAKLLVADQEAAVTAMGITFGDPRYISPEQATGKEIDRRADLYSLGVIAYEMLTGTPPYTGANLSEIIDQHLTARIPSVRDKRPDCPEWLDLVIRRAMAKSPEKRFLTVLRMHECLKSEKAPTDIDPRELDASDVKASAAPVAPIVVAAPVAAVAVVAPAIVVEKTPAVVAPVVVAPVVAAPVAVAPQPAAPIAAVVAAPEIKPVEPTVTSEEAAAAAREKRDNAKTLLDFISPGNRESSKTIVPGGAPPAVGVRDLSKTIAPGGAPPAPVALHKSEEKSKVVVEPSVVVEVANVVTKPIVSKSGPAITNAAAAASAAAATEAGRKSKKQLKAERRAGEQQKKSSERPAVAQPSTDDARKAEAKENWKPSAKPVDATGSTELAPIIADRPAPAERASAVEAVPASVVVSPSVVVELAASSEASPAATVVAERAGVNGSAKPDLKVDVKDGKRDKRAGGKEETPEGKAPDVTKRPGGRSLTPGAVGAVSRKTGSHAAVETGEHERIWFDGDAPVVEEFEAPEQKRNVGLIAGIAVGALTVVVALSIAILGRSDHKDEGPHRSYNAPAVSAALEGQQPASPNPTTPSATGNDAPPPDPKAIEEKRLADEKRAADEKAAEDKRVVDEQKAAEEKRIADEGKSASEKAADAKRAAEQKRAADKKAAEDKIAEDKRVAAEKRAADKLAAEEKVARVAEEKRAAAEKRAADKKAADEKSAEDRRLAAEKRAADRKAADEKSSEDKRLAGEKRAADRKAADDRRAADNRAAEDRRIAADRQAHPSSKPAGKQPADGFHDPFSAKAAGQADDYIKLGRQKLNAGDVTGAMSQFSKAREIDGSSAEAISGVGECEFEQGDYTGAAVHLKQAAHLAPRRAHVAVLLGQAYFKLGRFKDAVSECKRALKLDARNQEAAQTLEAAERKLSGN